MSHRAALFNCETLLMNFWKVRFALAVFKIRVRWEMHYC